MSRHAGAKSKSVVVNVGTIIAVSPVLLATSNVLFYSGFNPELIKVLVVNLDVPRILMGALLSYISLILSLCILAYNVSRDSLDSWSDNLVDTILTLTMGYYAWYGPWPIGALPLFFFLSWHLYARLSKVIASRNIGPRLKTFWIRMLESLPAIVIFLVLASSVTNMWLPEEKMATVSGELKGYELNSSDGWTTFLLSKDKSVKVVKNEDIKSKKLCIQSTPVSLSEKYIALIRHESPKPKSSSC